jgi:lipoprotein-releasing system ATP-binding protein
MLVLDNISMCYDTADGPLAVLRSTHLKVQRGESVSISGPSGSGKSTLLNIVGTLERPTSGTIAIDGTNPFDLDDRALAEFRNRHIGFVFQEHHLLPQCSAFENVLLPTLAASTPENHTPRAEELLQRVGLTHRKNHLPSQLSGGERQRVAIARALMCRPAVVLADEPTGNLDRSTANGVSDLLWNLHEEDDTVLIVATHNEDLAARAQSEFELIDGQLVSQSKTT